MMLVKSSISIEAHFLSLHISLFLSQTFFQINLAISLSLSISKQLRMSFQGTLVSITWGFVALGSYLTYCILKYIKEKPPGAQTLLDGIHCQMFQIWMVENWMVLLRDTIIIWGFKSELTAWMDLWIWHTFCCGCQCHSSDDLCGDKDCVGVLPRCH